ncbi:MAG: hypothetical protein A4E45_01620 [Methanosaeta sp. PtaB.Bin039]|nr:MAG: hypothetical protein A4E45_01620 [Methanosaeta sp. PtaB.Bin039]OPY44228.1 MAG: hypothetical protein A4E47_01695 [Methanosaeta sp. PtaU1.Bin028]HOT07241.1 hypothetical protein [Methanotrichaceae archaeon]HQF17269.1 hypothetical protein [Methanotrichaceae archaeon]HQI91842.1 hypothetical protein [Methanotrichaceae archaeon]
MYEDIGALLGNGFQTWRRNLNLAMPFLLSSLASILLLMPLVAFFVWNLDPNMDLKALSEQEALKRLPELAPILAIGMIGFALAVTFIGSYFSAGAVGMAKDACATGWAEISSLWRYGRRYVLPLFLATIIGVLLELAGIAIMAGVLFLAVGNQARPLIEQLMAQPDQLDPSMIPADLALAILGGILIIALFLMILSLILAMVPIAMVVEDLGAVASITGSARFFRQNIFDVFVIWLTVFALSMALSVPSQIAPDLAPLWSMLSTAASLLVLSPLATVWWTRLFMNRTGKELYQSGSIPLDEI